MNDDIIHDKPLSTDAEFFAQLQENAIPETEPVYRCWRCRKFTDDIGVHNSNAHSGD